MFHPSTEIVTLTVSRVPPRERRDCEDDPCQEAEAVAEPEKTGVESPLPHRHAGEYPREPGPASRSYAFRVVEDVRETPRSDIVDALGSNRVPTLDPDVVRRSYQLHRARRRARSEHRRRTKRAGARFWVVFVLLVGVAVFIALTTWREIGRLFGL